MKSPASADASRHLTDPFLTPATLAMSLWPDGSDMWIPQKHLLYAASRITHAIMKGNGRLIVSMPPRHGKSRLISESTIPWFLQKFVKRNMMFVAYNDDFAEEWGMKAKDIIRARQDLFSYNIREDRSRVDRFETTTGGTCWFGGINGGQTGKGAHLVIIDDYIKDIEDAMSKSMRDKTWAKFVANIHTRLEPGATIIIVATRWWSDDLIGRILKHLKGWENICFPAIATPEVCTEPGGVDILGRRPGDVLFPERYGMGRIGELQAAMKVSGTIFDALIQQRPIDDQSDFTDGGWLRVAQGVSLDGMLTARAWDFASKQGGGDWTTGTKMGRKGLSRQAYIFNIIRKQISPLKIEQLIRRTAVADGTDCVVLLETEPGSQGTALVEHYRTNVLPEFEVIAVPAGNKSKILKAQPLISGVESGNVYLVDDPNAVEEAEWIKTFREEFDAFPPSSGGHDDQVDTASICYNHLFQNDVIAPSWGSVDTHTMHNGRLVLRPGMSLEDAELVAKLDHVYSDGTESGKLVTGVVW
jgi:predicted phage terminase large subunit-like protein